MNNLHPVFQQALAPFVQPARVLKAGAGNRNLSPMVTAKVYQVGKNKYEVTLACPEWDQELPYDSATQFGLAFRRAAWFSILGKEDAQFEVDTLRAYLFARQ